MPSITDAPEKTARALYATQRFAALGTVMPDGSPYVSLVQSAVGPTGGIVMFLSDLAQHTQNITKNPQASVLIDGTEGEAQNRLAGARLTVLGRVQPDACTATAEAFFSRHPDSMAWRMFKDFNMHLLTPERAHMVGGFGQIDWLSPNQFMSFSER